MAWVESSALRPLASPTMLAGCCVNEYGARMAPSVLVVERFAEEMLTTITHHLRQGSRAEAADMIRTGLLAPLALAADAGDTITDLVLANLA